MTMDDRAPQISPFDFNSAPLMEGAVTLLSDIFGKGDHIQKHLLKVSSDPNVCVLSASLNSELIGIGIARIENESELESKRVFGEECVRLLKGHKVGSFQNLAVAKSHRKTGVGLKIGSELFAWLRARGCEWILADAWNNGSAESSHGLLERAGFKKLGTAKDFYLEASLRHGYVCALCSGPCRCSATLYALEFKK